MNRLHLFAAVCLVLALWGAPLGAALSELAQTALVLTVAAAGLWLIVTAPLRSRR